MDAAISLLEKLITLVADKGMPAVLIICLGIMVFVFIKILNFLGEQGKLHNQNYENLSANIQKNTSVTSEMNDYLHKRNGTLDSQLEKLCNEIDSLAKTSKK